MGFVVKALDGPVSKRFGFYSPGKRIPTWIALDTSSEDRDGTRQQGDKGSEGMDTKPYTGTTRADSFVQITIEQ